ncbi:hypothetical protein BCT63_20580 [Vibrio kanaloae]|nr:hypothetical protein BCT63_20580 [Vibrio kanaloae]
MKYSFVLCVNKKCEYLGRAIESVLTQEYRDFEFIIVANNCDDELFSYLSFFKDERIRLFRTKIGQLSFNLNYAINLARGDYIVRMDADDISLPNRLLIIEKNIEQMQDFDVICFKANIIDETDEFIRKSPNIGREIIIDDFLRSNPVIHPSVVLKKDALLKCRGYLGGFQSEDYELWLRMVLSHQFRIVHINETVINYRIHSQQSRGNMLPLCEVNGYFYRNFLISPSLKIFKAMLLNFSRYLKFILCKK